MKNWNFIRMSLLAITAGMMLLNCQKSDSPSPTTTTTPTTGSTTSTTVSSGTKVTYEKDIKAIFVSNCSPCHVAGGDQASKWDNFATAKSSVANILDRIQLAPNAVGFMPNGKATKLPDATINLIKQWQTDGLLEK